MCDIHSSPCYEIYYGVVVAMWLVSTTAVMCLESYNFMLYFYASFLFKSLGVALGKVRR